MKGLGDFMKQAQAMQENMQKIQQEIAAMEVHTPQTGGTARHKWAPLTARSPDGASHYWQ